MRFPWVLIIAALPTLYGGFYKGCVLNAPALKAQSHPTWISGRMDLIWRKTAKILVEEIQKERDQVHAELIRETKKLPEGADLLETDESEMNIEGSYGQLPEVQVDQGSGAIFPAPLSDPGRFSWFQVAVGGRNILSAIRYLRTRIEHWKQLPLRERAMKFDPLNDLWNEIGVKMTSLTRQARYLESWIPPLQKQWKEERAKGSMPASYVLTEAIRRGDPALIEPLRELLRPRRVLFRAYLPDSLDVDPEIELPIVTDVHNGRFLAEVEGALETYWTDSSWAKNQGVHFRVHWFYVPKDQEFAAGKITLAEHLAKFPDDRAAMTTGGLTTYVKGQALILGPGKINPRTLAHELGHLMGFADCYLRTLSSQGFFGQAVLEWDNPLYPDDLMCDNNVGAVRAEVW